jgi:hypothetical protein
MHSCACVLTKFGSLPHGCCDQPNFKRLLASAQKRYSKELVRVEDIFSSDEEFSRFLAKKFDTDIPAEKDKVWREVQKLCLSWTKARVEAQAQASHVATVKFVPHHTQIVILLMMVEVSEPTRSAHSAHPHPLHSYLTAILVSLNSFLCHQFFHTAKSQKSYVAEIGTGEGKSVVIALLAAYLALQGKKVHVLVNNRALLKRDFASNQRFFAMLGLTSAEGTGAPGESEEVLDGEGDWDEYGSGEGGEDSAGKAHAEPNIRYLVMSDISKLWREQVLQHKDSSPFRQHVLVVDEVDELIVDEIPLFCHMSSFPHLNAQLISSYDALLANEQATRPASVTDDHVWGHAVEARTEAAKMVQGEHFVLEEGRYWKREEKVSGWSSGCSFVSLPVHPPADKSLANPIIARRHSRR